MKKPRYKIFFCANGTVSYIASADSFLQGYMPYFQNEEGCFRLQIGDKENHIVKIF